MTNRRRRQPRAPVPAGPPAGLTEIQGVEIGHYRPVPGQPPTEVHMIIRTREFPPFVMRFAGPSVVNHLIATFANHRDYVWPVPPVYDEGGVSIELPPRDSRVREPVPVAQAGPEPEPEPLEPPHPDRPGPVPVRLPPEAEAGPESGPQAEWPAEFTREPEPAPPPPADPGPTPEQKP